MKMTFKIQRTRTRNISCFVPFIFSVSEILVACGSKPPQPSQGPPPQTQCAGDSCVSWTGVHSDSCYQFDPHAPNLAYQVATANFYFTEPITIFYSLIQKNAQGVDIATIPGQTYSLGNYSSVLRICHAAMTPAPNGQVVTQRLIMDCITNRQLPNGATGDGADGIGDDERVAGGVVGLDVDEVQRRVGCASDCDVVGSPLIFQR